MPSIYVAGVFATLLASFVIGGIIFWKSSKEEKKLFIAAIVLQLPMCAVMYYFVREPYLRKLWIVISSYLNPGLDLESLKKTTSYFFMRAFEAPLAEDLAKLWPLLIPWFRKQITRQNAVKTAMALGLGFGLGEMWFIAELLFRVSPDKLPLHWYQFYLLGGYIGERLMVCFMHGAFVSVALCQLGRGTLRFILGILGMMALHFIGNFPLSLAQINWGGLGSSGWMIFINLWVVFYFLAMLVLLAFLALGNVRRIGVFFFGQMKCPECEMIYDRPFFGFNFAVKRYERCPHCCHFHWVNENKALKPEK